MYRKFEAVDHGVAVIREGRFLYANEACLRLVGARLDELIGDELVSVIAPEDRERVLGRYWRRVRGEPVPVEYEAALLAGGDGRRTVRLRAEREGVDVVVQIFDVTESVSRRDRLHELARLGVAIQSERSDEAVFRALCDRLPALELAAVVLRPDGDGGVIELLAAGPALLEVARRTFGSLPVGFRGSLGAPGRLAWEQGAAFSDDTLLGIAEFFGGELGERARRLAADSAQIARGGVVRLDVGGEPSVLLLLLGDWLSEEDLPALRLFGAQVSAALTAGRTIADLSRRNAELASLNRLAALARTAPSLEALFREGLEEIRSYFRCPSARIHLVDEQLRELVLTHAQEGRAEAREHPLRPSAAMPDALVWRVVQRSEPVVERLADARGVARDTLAQAGIKVLAAVPLMARSAVVGILSVGFCEEREVPAADLEQLQAMGSYFGAAVEAQRLLRDLRQRVDELTLVHEVGRALVVSLELDEVLDAATRNLARTTDAPTAFLVLVDTGGEHLVVRAVYGADTHWIGRRLAATPAGSSLAARAFLEQQTLVIEDAETDPRVNHALQQETGGRAYMALPLVVRGVSIGAAVIIDPRGPRRFRQAEVDRAAAIGNQIAVAVENARLYDHLRHSYSELARTQAQLVERERLAAIGELAAVIAHEVRNPLNVIFNSLGALRRMIKLDSNASMLFDIVGEEADRLNRIVGDLLDYARPVVLSVKRESLARVVDDAVAAALSTSDAGISLQREVDPHLPLIAMDARHVRQAVLNVALNAVQAMPQGGTLRVRVQSESNGRANVASIVVTDTGPGIPAELRQRIFEPFFTTKSTGTGLGLAVVKRIVDSHGGTVLVASEVGAGTTFTIRLPLDQRAAGDTVQEP